MEVLIPLYGIENKMGVINSFVIQLSKPVLAENLEAYIKEKSIRMGLNIKLYHDSPQREFKSVSDSYMGYTNVLDMYFPILENKINGELEYGIEDLSQAINTVTYSGYYSDFITDIYKIGVERFIDILKELFCAVNVSWETM